jgi:hypothetical protein
MLPRWFASWFCCHKPVTACLSLLQVCDDGILEADYTEDDIAKVVCAQLGYACPTHVTASVALVLHSWLLALRQQQPLVSCG